MKRSNVKLGGVYKTKVHGQYRQVRVDAIAMAGFAVTLVLTGQSLVRLRSARELHET